MGRIIEFRVGVNSRWAVGFNKFWGDPLFAGS